MVWQDNSVLLREYRNKLLRNTFKYIPHSISETGKVCNMQINVRAQHFR